LIKIIFVTALFMMGEALSLPFYSLLVLPLIPLVKYITAQRLAGRLLAVLFIPCAAVTASAVCYRLAVFISKTSLTRTLAWLIAALTLALAFFLYTGGVRSLTKWAAFTFPLVAGFVVLAALLLAGKMAVNGFAAPRFFEQSYILLACEGITLLGLLPAMEYREKPLRVYLSSLAAAFVICSAVWAMTNLTLGAQLVQYLEYPFHNTLRVAKGGEVIGRVEAFLIPVVLSITVLKSAACMTVVSWSVMAVKYMIDKPGANSDN
jgi:hypothetical protein